jgi:uncharacterized membrane protein (DUF485 family)
MKTFKALTSFRNFLNTPVSTSTVIYTVTIFIGLLSLVVLSSIQNI